MAGLDVIETPKLVFIEGAAPGTPAAGIVYIYAKADGLLYSKDDAGTETVVSGGGSLADHNHTAAGGDGGDLDAPIIDGYAVFNEEAAPSTPASGTVAVYAKADGHLYQKDDAGTETDLAAAAGGALPDQVLPYPTSFSGNDEDGASAANWADVAAFDTKEILNSKVLHLVTLGASKDQKVRKTLSSTKAGAFDFRFRGMMGGNYWSGAGDVYHELRLSTAADAQVAIARIYYTFDSTTASRIEYWQGLRVGGSSIAAADANQEPKAPHGLDWNLRIARDGSDVVRFYYALGPVPLALPQVLIGTDVPYSVSSAGTVARVELITHTPAGPSGTAQFEQWWDYFDDV